MGPAFVRDDPMDLLAVNRLARAFYADPRNQENLARFTFLSPDARRVYPDWDQAADITVAILRTEAGRSPHDKDLRDLVGELSTRSDAPTPAYRGRRTERRRRGGLPSRGGGRPAPAQTGEGAVVDAAQEQQGAGGADQGAEHVPLGVPDVSLRAQESVRGLASGDRREPFQHLEDGAEGEAGADGERG